jgi:hypothetical protein
VYSLPQRSACAKRSTKAPDFFYGLINGLCHGADSIAYTYKLVKTFLSSSCPHIYSRTLKSVDYLGHHRIAKKFNHWP